MDEEQIKKGCKRGLAAAGGLIGGGFLLCMLGLVLELAGSDGGRAAREDEQMERAAYTPVPTFTSTPAASEATSHASQAQPMGTPQPTPIPPEPTSISTSVAPTVTPVSPSPIPPAVTPTLKPVVTTNSDMNVRSGPGTNHSIVGTASTGQQYAIAGKNWAGNWWEVEYHGKAAQVFGPLVTSTNASHERTAAQPISTTRSLLPRTPRLTAKSTTKPLTGCAVDNVPEPPSNHLDCDTWEVAYMLIAVEAGIQP
ncbi:MAG: hypothetical protein OXF62_14420 [Caldilineaceae bacterium]|nr:hypothetical protein [Caldilineaceae bacterium]